MAIDYAYYPSEPGPSHSKRITQGDYRARLEHQMVELLDRASDFDESALDRLTDLELCQMVDSLVRVIR